MYLAKHVGGWSLPKIGRFYNGRHHTTVLHAVEKIERLRKADEAFDALLDVLTATLTSEGKRHGTDKIVSSAHSELLDAIASRVIQRLRRHYQVLPDGQPGRVSGLITPRTQKTLSYVFFRTRGCISLFDFDVCASFPISVASSPSLPKARRAPMVCDSQSP